jgi:polyhydroxyalkanoate synthesis regulator phasin
VSEGAERTDSAERTAEGAERSPLGQLLLAGLGWASLTAEAADELADDLARRVGIERDKMRTAVRDTLTSWRRDAERMGRRRTEALDHGLERLGVVRREEHDDLALRVAQLEHRVKLLERG